MPLFNIAFRWLWASGSKLTFNNLDAFIAVFHHEGESAIIRPYDSIARKWLITDQQYHAKLHKQAAKHPRLDPVELLEAFEKRTKREYHKLKAFDWQAFQETCSELVTRIRDKYIETGVWKKVLGKTAKEEEPKVLLPFAQESNVLLQPLFTYAVGNDGHAKETMRKLRKAKDENSKKQLQKLETLAKEAAEAVELSAKEMGVLIKERGSETCWQDTFRCEGRRQEINKSGRAWGLGARAALVVKGC